MSEVAMPGGGTTDSAGMWVVVPAAGQPIDVLDWASDQASAWARVTGADLAATARVADFLGMMFSIPRMPGFDWRLVLVTALEAGAAVFDLAALRGADLDIETLVGRHAPSELGSEYREFTHDTVSGVQCAIFSIEPGETEVGSITAAVTVAVPRPSTGVTFVARTVTDQLRPMMAALLPLQYLLTSEEILDLVSGPA